VGRVRGENLTEGVSRTFSLDADGPEPRLSRMLMAASALAFVLTACVPAQWDYLIEATDRATQEDVEDHLGAPDSVKVLEDDNSLWTYRYESTSSWWGKRSDMVGGLPCAEYRLTFDRQKILRYWVRQDC